MPWTLRFLFFLSLYLLLLTWITNLYLVFPNQPQESFFSDLNSMCPQRTYMMVEKFTIWYWEKCCLISFKYLWNPPETNHLFFSYFVYPCEKKHLLKRYENFNFRKKDEYFLEVYIWTIWIIVSRIDVRNFYLLWNNTSQNKLRVDNELQKHM